MIEPGTGAEQLYVRNLAAYRVRAIQAATAGEPYAYLDEAFREAVKRVGRTFESRNDGLVEWAELLAKEVLAGKAVPGVDALVLNADAIAADKAELATLAAGGLPVEEPEKPEKKEEPKKAEAKPEPEKKVEAKPAAKVEKKTEPEKKVEAKKAEPEKKAEPSQWYQSDEEKAEAKAEPKKKAESEIPTHTHDIGQSHDWSGEPVSPSKSKADPEKKGTTTTTTTAPAKTGSAQKVSDDWYTMSGEKKAKTTTTTTAAPTTTTTTPGTPAEFTSAETKKAR